MGPKLNEVKKNYNAYVNSGEQASSRPAQHEDLASRFQILNSLLNTLTDVLDIREVFDRVSLVVQRVLPHDLMGVMEISEGGDRIRRYAAAGSGKATFTYEAAVPEPLTMADRARNAMIIEDFQSHPLAKGSPPLKAGMKTALSAPIRFGGRLQAVLNFFSRQPEWFTRTCARGASVPATCAPRTQDAPHCCEALAPRRAKR